MQRKEKFTAVDAGMLALTLLFAVVSILYAARIPTDSQGSGTLYRIEPEQGWANIEPLPERVLVNVNTASAIELAQLPGIGPVLAQAIVDEREANGPFDTLDDLLRVNGIGSAKLEALREDACALPAQEAEEPEETEENAA